MNDPFERAAERAEAEYSRHRTERSERGHRAALRIHATAFVAVQVLLVVVWALAGAGYPWFLYAVVGWGIGLAVHYAAVRDQLGRGGG
jgi:2TM domain